MKRRPLRWLVVVCCFVLQAAAPSASKVDPRDIANGYVIPDEGYCDQPYVVITNDGKWLCVMTTGPGKEGQQHQHIVSTISPDHGKTWSPLVDIEPGDGPEASWVMPFKTPSGRVYVFYTYNKDNLRQVTSNRPQIGRRVDTLGAYMLKYSDDNGHTWSARRYEIPMRKMRIDRENYEHGRVLFFWGVGKPILYRRSVIFGFAKVGRWGWPGGMIESQGCFLRCDNILTEKDPSRLRWVLLPDGDEGLRAPKGPVSDEANLVALSDGSLYATYRTIDGYNCAAYSRDGGHGWTHPAYAVYSPGGRRIKHPRAANFVRRFSNGKYLLWFHNHGGEAAVAQPDWRYYDGRNPGWITGGIEKGGHIYWAQPEILLYDKNPATKISYPDFIEENGRYFITETQKTVARVHEVAPTLLEGLWNQFDNKSVASGGTILGAGEAMVEMPRLPLLSAGGGFTIDMWVRFKELTRGQVILDTREGEGPGIALETSNRFTLKLTLSDGARESNWDSDPGTHAGTLRVGRWQHIAVIVDGGPKIISFVVDGVLNDGGAVRDYGWGRFDPALGDVNGKSNVELAPALSGELKMLRVYGRALRTSEAVGNYRAGM